MPSARLMHTKRNFLNVSLQYIFMKKLSIIACAFISTICGFAQENVVDKVIWVVGDEPILLSDVEETRLSQEAHGTPVENPYAVIPEQIAIQKLFVHQAQIDSVVVSDAMIDAEIEQEIEYYMQMLGSKENIEAWSGRTMAQYRTLLRKKYKDQEMMRGEQQKLTKQIKVTPAEIREFLKTYPEDSIPMIPTQVEVQIITAIPQPTREEVERIETKLRDIAKRVNSGEKEFSAMARSYSEDGSFRNGGELGLTGRNQWVPEFADVAFSLNDPKKVSKIVRTEFGFHIMQLIEKRGDKVNVRHILLKPTIEQEEYTKQLTYLNEIADSVRNGVLTFDEAAFLASADKDTRSNHGLMVNVLEDRSVTSRFKMKELPQDVAKVVDTLQVGQISESFLMTTKTGQTVCCVVKLKSRIDAHRASITEDFQVLRELVTEKRCSEYLDKWIADKIKTTYVKIDPQWRNYNFKYDGWIKEDAPKQ